MSFWNKVAFEKKVDLEIQKRLNEERQRGMKHLIEESSRNHCERGQDVK